MLVSGAHVQRSRRTERERAVEAGEGEDAVGSRGGAAGQLPQHHTQGSWRGGPMRDMRGGGDTARRCTAAHHASHSAYLGAALGHREQQRRRTNKHRAHRETIEC